MTPDPTRPTLSVIVPAHNAARYIEPCLNGLFAAGFTPAEIIVVDDASRDGTVAAVRQAGLNPLILESNLGAAGARNAGAAAAQGDILVFVDADVVVHQDVRDRILARFGTAGAPDAVFGSYDDAPAHPSPVSRLRNLLHHHVHQINAGPRTSFWTGLGAVRRDAFRAVGGFDTGIAMMEDIELGMRLHLGGYRIELDPALQGTHLKRWTWASMAHTDLWNRAVPWTRLILSEAGQRLPPGLNVSATDKLSVAAVGLSLLSIAALGLSGLAALLGLILSAALLVLANRGFLRFVHRLDGPVQTLRAVAMLWVHYLCAGLGFALVKLRLV